MWGIIYWPKYLIVASLFFLIPEIIALFTNTANTLSAYCWNELRVGLAFGHGEHTLAWWVSLVAWSLFVIIITGHIWWRTL